MTFIDFDLNVNSPLPFIFFIQTFIRSDVTSTLFRFARSTLNFRFDMVVVCVVCSSSFRGKAWRIPCCECNRPAHRGCISSIPQEIIGQLYKAGMSIDFLCKECSALHNDVTSSDGVPGLVIPAAVEDNLSALHNNVTSSDGVPGLVIPAVVEDNHSALIDNNLLASVLSHSLNISNCNLLSSTR
jgi:hypothetical protein